MSHNILPAYARPSKFTYGLRQLKRFPSRLLCPCDPGVGTVRSLRITPKFDVKLEDVLNARHLPPLGLKEFEEYLLFVEHSAENMYFWFWLKQYEETYARLGSEDDKDGEVARELRESYACARATFLVPNASLELNLSAEALDSLPPPPLPSSSEPPVHPGTFATARTQVTLMLQHSLHAFVGAHSRNAGRNRGIFAIVVGLLIAAVGLAPILLSFYRYGRFLAFAALPCIWMGVGTLVAGFHGVCIVIFLFGDARQLHPFELVSPSEAELLQARTPRSRRSSTAKVDKDSIGRERALAAQLVPMSFDTGRTRRSDSTCSSSQDDSEKNPPTARRVQVTAAPRTGDLGLPLEPSSHTIIAPFLAGPDSLSHSASPRSPAGSFNWEIKSSSSSTLEKRSRASESFRSLFAPMTEVLSPIVRRGQWQIVVRSFAVGLVVALVVCGICAAPYRGRR